MFYYIEGNVAIVDANLAVIDAGGVGYCCHTTANTLSYLEVGKRARLYTYCNIKEDVFDIYGFHDLTEKRSFEMLLSVSGVGPKAAISILSSATPEHLALSIISGDEKVLTSAPGIGKRIAQRIILELKDKVAKENKTIDFSTVPQISGMQVKNSKVNDASAALAVLGFSPSEITSILRTIDVEALSIEDIVKQALRMSLK